MKEVFWQNRQSDEDSHYMHCTHLMHCTRTYTSTLHPTSAHRSQQRISTKLSNTLFKSLFCAFFSTADTPHIDLLHLTVPHKMLFCALVNKYFSYFVLAYPFSASLAPLPSISIDLCMIYTLYDSF